jgi:hypothetical protein
MIVFKKGKYSDLVIYNNSQHLFSKLIIASNSLSKIMNRNLAVLNYSSFLKNGMPVIEKIISHTFDWL